MDIFIILDDMILELKELHFCTTASTWNIPLGCILVMIHIKFEILLMILRFAKSIVIDICRYYIYIYYIYTPLDHIIYICIYSLVMCMYLNRGLISVDFSKIFSLGVPFSNIFTHL